MIKRNHRISEALLVSPTGSYKASTQPARKIMGYVGLTEDENDDYVDETEEDDEDGWSETVQDELYDVMDKMDSFLYEVRNCIKGSYTHCSTNDELADYIEGLADRLTEAAEYVRNC